MKEALDKKIIERHTIFNPDIPDLRTVMSRDKYANPLRRKKQGKIKLPKIKPTKEEVENMSDETWTYEVYPKRLYLKGIEQGKQEARKSFFEWLKNLDCLTPERNEQIKQKIKELDGGIKEDEK